MAISTPVKTQINHVATAREYSQKQTFLTISGNRTGSFLTQATVLLHDDILRFQKGPNGYMSDLVIVVAKTDENMISLILVEGDREGFTKGKPLKKIGMKAQDTCELFFDNVRVPNRNVLGEPHDG